MKIHIAVLAVMLTIGCGGGGGGSSPAPTPPVAIHAPGISNLQFSPVNTTRGAGGGALSVGGSFNFTDAGGDLASLTLTSYYSSGTVASTGTIPITGTNGALVGAVNLYLNINTTVADNFRFEAYAIDTAGSRSNTLTGTFLITDSTPTTHAPIISNFQFTPSSVAQGSGSGTVSVVGKFNFSDAGGDMTTVTYLFYNLSGVVTGTSTGPITGIAGITNGWVQSSFTANTNTAGTLRMDVFTTDALGSNSNTTSQNLQIVAPGPIASPTETNVKPSGNSELDNQFMTLKGARLVSSTTPVMEKIEGLKLNSSEFLK